MRIVGVGLFKGMMTFAGEYLEVENEKTRQRIQELEAHLSDNNARLCSVENQFQDLKTSNSELRKELAEAKSLLAEHETKLDSGSRRDHRAEGLVSAGIICSEAVSTSRLISSGSKSLGV